MTIVSPAASEWRFDRGGDVITGTGTVTGRWRGLQALGTGCTLDAGTAAADLSGTLTGVVIPRVQSCTVVLDLFNYPAAPPLHTNEL
jgi:hypothetical protein